MFPMQMNSVSNMAGMKPGMKKKTRRGGRGGKNKHKGVNSHHAAAKGHMESAMQASTPQAAHGHLFKALTALNKAKKGSPIGSAPSAGVPVPPPDVNMAPAGPSAMMSNG